MERFEVLPDASEVRMTEAEAEAVVSRFLDQQSLGEPGVDTKSLAHTLRISEAEVARLLEEVRQSRSDKAQRAKSFRTRLRDSFVALVAAVAFLTVLAAGVAWYWFSLVQGDRQRLGYTGLESLSISVGTDTVRMAAPVNSLDAASNNDLRTLVSSKIENMITEQVTAFSPDPVLRERTNLIAAIESGDYTSSYFRLVRIDLKGGPEGQYAGDATLPIYLGRDREIQSSVLNERSKRIGEAIFEMQTSARVQTGTAR